MAKRLSSQSNPFANDFAELTQKADDQVLAFIKQKESKNVSKQDHQAANPEVVKKPEKKAGIARKSSSENKSPKKSAKVLEWGKPVALFNTRIPIELSELLDDLVYKLKKKGTPQSKQELAKEALTDLLKKHAMI